MDFHAVAAIFPMMEGEEYDAFKQDIKEHGLKEPIVTYQNLIIDGRNRYRASRELNIKPVYTEWNGEGLLTEHVVSLNLHRRHLTTNQRAMLGAKIKDSLSAEAHERMAKTQFSANPAARDNYPYPCADTGKSVDLAAKIVKVSPFPVREAAYVCKHGTPELIEAAQSSIVAMHNAATLADLEPIKQRELVAAGSDAMLLAAQEICAASKTTKTPPIHHAKGIGAIAKHLDTRIDFYAKSDLPHAAAIFDELRQVRAFCVGR